MFKILLLSTLLFIACEDKTYTKIYQKDIIGSHISSLLVINTQKEIRTPAIKAIKDSGFELKENSPYSIDIEYRKYSHHCNNPLTPSYDATYDGFVKLHLYHGLKELYSVQKDFHGEFDEEKLKQLIEKMKEDLKLS